MSAIDDKLDHCRLALEGLKASPKSSSIPLFLARFTAYVNHTSAIRQYLQAELTGLKAALPTADQIWFQEFEEDINIAAAMALRHIDQHTTAIHVSHIDMTLPATVISVSNGEVAWALKDADGVIVRESPPCGIVRVAGGALSGESEMMVRYFCDASALSGFMIAQRSYPKGYSWIRGQGSCIKRGDDLPLKPTVIEHLRNTDLLSLAEACQDSLFARLVKGKERGLFL